MEVVECDDDFDSSDILEKLGKISFDVKEALIFDFKQITPNSIYQQSTNFKETESNSDFKETESNSEANFLQKYLEQKYLESNGTFKFNITDLKLNSLDSLKSNVIIQSMTYGRRGGFRNDNQ